jgi:hypothetical protein
MQLRFLALSLTQSAGRVKMENKWNILKTKFKLSMIKLLGLSSIVDDLIEDKDCEIRMLQMKLERLQKKYEIASNEYDYYRQKSLATISEKVHLDYDKITGEYPILIVRANRNTPMNNDMFTRIRYHINQVCPKIDLIMFMYDDMKIEQINDEQLAQAGLKRVVNE